MDTAPERDFTGRMSFTTRGSRRPIACTRGHTPGAIGMRVSTAGVTTA